MFRCFCGRAAQRDHANLETYKPDVPERADSVYRSKSISTAAPRDVTAQVLL